MHREIQYSEWALVTAPEYASCCTVWRETLVPLKLGKIDERPKVNQIFTIQIFTHLWLKSHVNNEYRTNSLEDIS